MSKTSLRGQVKYRCINCNRNYYCYNDGHCDTSYCIDCKPPSNNGNELVGKITHGEGELIIGDLARAKSGVIFLKNTVCYHGCSVKFYEENDKLYEECDPKSLKPLATVRNNLWRFLECNNCNSYYADGRGNLQGVDVPWCLIRGGSCEPSSYDTNLSLETIYNCCALKFFRRYCNSRPPEWCLEKIDGKDEYYIVSRPYHTHKKYYMMIDLRHNLPVVLPVWYDNALRYKRLKFIPVDRSTITTTLKPESCGECNRPEVIENYGK